MVATIRDATVAFGAEYGALLVPVERRIVQYLQQHRLFVVGGLISDGRSCHSLNAVAGWGASCRRQYRGALSALAYRIRQAAGGVPSGRGHGTSSLRSTPTEAQATYYHTNQHLGSS